MPRILHGDVELYLFSIPIGLVETWPPAVTIYRYSRTEWVIQGEKPRRLLAAIDRLMGPADRERTEEKVNERPYHYPRKPRSRTATLGR